MKKKESDIFSDTFSSLKHCTAKCKINYGRTPRVNHTVLTSKFAMVLLHVALSSPLISPARTPPIRPSELNSHRTSLKQPRTSHGLNISSSYHSRKEMPLNPPLSQSVLAIILDDGSETKLYPLTKRISKGAIPIAANYRLIDIVVSNCINSNIIRIYALTQFNSSSLNSHLSRAYSNIGLGKDGFVEILTAYQSPEEQGWFKGNADAVRRWLWLLKDHPVEEFLVLSSHHIYEMDYAKLIKRHRDSRADITVAVSCNRRNNNPSYDFLIQNHRNKFLEVRHAPDKDQDNFAAIGNSTKEEVCGARSMGIYVIKRDIMIKLLEKVLPKANDFRSEVIQGAISMGMKVHAYMFDGQWEDVETIEAFYHANIESARRTSRGFNFHDRNSPIYTMRHCLPPTVLTNALIRESIIGDGCILHTEVQQNWTKLQGFNVPVGIGEHTHIRKAIVDKNARIGRNVRIVNTNGVQECDREEHGYIISGGIVVVLSNAVIPDGSIL